MTGSLKCASKESQPLGAGSRLITGLFLQASTFAPTKHWMIMLTFRVVHFSSKPLAGITDWSILFWATLFKKNYLLLVASLSARVGRDFRNTTVCVSIMCELGRREPACLCVTCHIYDIIYLFLTPLDWNRWNLLTTVVHRHSHEKHEVLRNYRNSENLFKAQTDLRR